MKIMTKDGTMLNGVDVNKLNDTVAAIKLTPAVARFRFANQNRWLSGSHTRSTIDAYYGALESHRRVQPFVMDSDEPPILLGNDIAANPGEYLLHALAACITSTMVYHAAARGMEIEELETSLEGDVDLHGFLGLRDDIRPGYQAIRVTIRIKGDLTDEEINEIGQFAPRYSALTDTLTKGTQVMFATMRK